MAVENRLVELLTAKMAREKRLIPVAEVAEKTGMTRQNASRWVHNRVKCYPASTIDSLCDYFGCTPGDLIIRKGGQAS